MHIGLVRKLLKAKRGHGSSSKGNAGFMPSLTVKRLPEAQSQGVKFISLAIAGAGSVYAGYWHVYPFERV